MLNERNTNWTDLLDPFGWEVIRSLGFDYIPNDRNIVTEALARDADGWAETWQALPGYSKAGMQRVAILCQMPLYDRKGGPEGTNEPVGLRGHWYSYFKVDFTQKFGMAIGDYSTESDTSDRRWSQDLSVRYAEFVDTGKVTYLDLWVEDDSRKVSYYYDTLFRHSNIILAVEKNSLMGKFEPIARRIGASVLFAGNGQPSKANIERVLRKRFDWHPARWNQWGEWEDETFAENPLIILHISDHDFAGESGVGPSFAEQARRYTDHILEARIGIKPEQLPEPWENTDHNKVKGLMIHKQNNSGQIGWVETKGLWYPTCNDCDYQFVVVGKKDQWGDDPRCPNCGSTFLVGLTTKKDNAYGYEVEALPSTMYNEFVIDTLLEILPYEFILGKLRDECRADPYDAADQVTNEFARKNDEYLLLQEEIERLEEIKREFENEINNALYKQAEPLINDWRDIPWQAAEMGEDAFGVEYEIEPAIQDPPTEILYDHAERGYNVWRPYERSDRTKKLVEVLRKNENVEIYAKEAEIDWRIDQNEIE